MKPTIQNSLNHDYQGHSYPLIRKNACEYTLEPTIWDASISDTCTKCNVKEAMFISLIQF